MRTATVYKITNTVNGKIYIGCTIQTHFMTRVNKHFKELHNRVHRNAVWVEEFHEFGAESFVVEVIETFEASRESIRSRESYWINHFNSYNTGYNLTYDGAGAVWANKTLSEEHKRHIGEAVSGENNGFYGKALIGENNGFYGKSHTEETKRLLSDGIKNKWLEEDYRNAQIKARLGHKDSEETCEKKRIARMGKHHAEETRSKISESNRIAWIKRREKRKILLQSNANEKDNNVT